MAPRLHKRVLVIAISPDYIKGLVRTLEAHLTIAQKKPLHQESGYKDPREPYPPHLDPNTTPACADFVRELVIGHVDLGRKHQHFLYRYLEVALKNMPNLEVVEARVLTK